MWNRLVFAPLPNLTSQYEIGIYSSNLIVNETLLNISYIIKDMDGFDRQVVNTNMVYFKGRQIAILHPKESLV